MLPSSISPSIGNLLLKHPRLIFENAIFATSKTDIMSFITILLIAIGLSMDSLAVSISGGICMKPF